MDAVGTDQERPGFLKRAGFRLEARRHGTVGADFVPCYAAYEAHRFRAYQTTSTKQEKMIIAGNAHCRTVPFGND